MSVCLFKQCQILNSHVGGKKNLVLSHPLGDLGVIHSFHLWLVGKCVVNFLVLIELFSTDTQTHDDS